MVGSHNISGAQTFIPSLAHGSFRKALGRHSEGTRKALGRHWEGTQKALFRPMQSAYLPSQRAPSENSRKQYHQHQLKGPTSLELKRVRECHAYPTPGPTDVKVHRVYTEVQIKYTHAPVRRCEAWSRLKIMLLPVRASEATKRYHSAAFLDQA